MVEPTKDLSALEDCVSLAPRTELPVLPNKAAKVVTTPVLDYPLLNEEDGIERIGHAAT